MYEAELEVATSAVRQACRICRDVRRAMVNEDTVTKKDRSPVTVADLSAQAVMSHILHGQFPDDPLMAEEDTTMLRDPGSEELRVRVLAHVQGRVPELTDETSLAAIDRGSYCGGPEGRFWTMDPVDGTKGYIRGDQYAVALALIVDGQVVLGVMGCPHLPARYVEHDVERGLLFCAVRGSGTNMQWLEDDGDAPITVSSVTDPAGAVICQSFESAHTSHTRADRIAERLGIQTESLRLDSQCKYGLVARGEGTIYMRLPSSRDYEEKIWDHAAGWIIVKEAGGEVTDVDGKPLDFTHGRTLKRNRGIIATNGHIHARVLDAVGAVVAEE
jgi:3'(2'), 5'-bisphosphate nucleotidase